MKSGIRFLEGLFVSVLQNQPQKNIKKNEIKNRDFQENQNLKFALSQTQVNIHYTFDIAGDS